MSALRQADMGPRAVKRGEKATSPQQPGSWSATMVTVVSFFTMGYLLAFGTRELFTTPLPSEGTVSQSDPLARKEGSRATGADPKQRFPGDSIHSVVTSSGDAYQNFQTRILYGTYQLVQKEPGGERLTGFTRILHRTVPDILMDEIPTFHVHNPLKPQCDSWCDYPVANRPPAIWEWFKAAAKNQSMIQGAWIMMIECDYVFMRPPWSPGNAYDPTVPGWQFFFDYIMPQHPNAVPWIQKLFRQDNISTVPASGPAPVILRFDDWMRIVPDYVDASRRMEADEEMKKALEWVREMYAWDVAVAMHPDIKVETEKPPKSKLMVQPPFDEGMYNATFTHYTWGALYHLNKTQIYRWEKRDFNDMKHVIKVPNIPMPVPFQEGILLEFDAPLTRPRHDLCVLYIGQMNKAINMLRDLSDEAAKLDKRIADFKEWKKQHEEKDLLTRNMLMVDWSPKRVGPGDGTVAGGTLEPQGTPAAAAAAAAAGGAKQRRLLRLQ